MDKKQEKVNIQQEAINQRTESLKKFIKKAIRRDGSKQFKVKSIQMNSIGMPSALSGEITIGEGEGKKVVPMLWNIEGRAMLENNVQFDLVTEELL